MGVVQVSRGSLEPASPELLSEPRIVARLARATLQNRTTVDWEDLAGNYDKIRDVIERVIPGFDDYNARVRFNLAVAHRLSGEVGKALAELARVLQARPGHAPAYHNRGLVYLQAGLYGQAAAEFAAALVHDPEHAEARARLREATEAQPKSPQSPPAPKPTVRAPQAEAEQSKLEVKCPRCGKLVKLHDQVCMRCGLDMDFPDQAVEPESATALRR